jgi:hypothetical protein
MKGKTNAVSGGNGMPTEKVNITLSSNQSSPSDLLGAKITLAYGTYTEQYIWEGKMLTLSIPSHVIYTLTFGDVEGYATPSMLELEAVGDNVRQIDALYQSELVVVTVAADSGISVAGQQVTINGVTTTLDVTGVVSQKIPYGTTYNVSVNGLSGYNSPVAQTFTASQAVRNTTLEYAEIKLGVFIQDTNGKLWRSDGWNSSTTANGIAVITSSRSFVIALSERAATPIYNKGYSSSMDLTVYSSGPTRDYAGQSNTAAMISAYGNAKTEAAGYCNNFIFPNGKKGYLGSAGEWKIAYNNKAEIQACLSKVGGSAIANDYHCSSTRASDADGLNRFWSLEWSRGGWDAGDVNYGDIARAFTTL